MNTTEFNDYGVNTLIASEAGEESSSGCLKGFPRKTSGVLPWSEVCGILRGGDHHAVPAMAVDPVKRRRARGGQEPNMALARPHATIA